MDPSEQERVREARIRARELGYNLLVEEAPNVEPITHMAFAAPHIPDTAVAAFFVAYGLSPGDAAEQGVVVLEIIQWFRGQSVTLRVEEEPDGSWRAPLIPDGSQVAFVIQGIGSTSLEAAEDARRRWEAGEQRGKTTPQIGTAIETNQAMPIKPSKSRVISPAIEVNEAMPVTHTVTPGGAKAGGVGSSVSVSVSGGGVSRTKGRKGAFGSSNVSGGGDVRTSGDKTSEVDIGGAEAFLARIGATDMGVFFAEEPDGTWRTYLANVRTWDVIRSTSGEKFIDAFLEIGLEFRDRSEEGREGRSDDPSDPRA